MIDLHIHSTFSDGSFTPRQIIKLAKDIGLTAIAITDHDTVGGIEESLKAGKEFDLPVVPGVELSIEEDFEIHILGLFINHRDPQLISILKKIKVGRRERNRKIIELLNSQGAALSFNKIAQQAGTEDFGRPHIAREMVETGFVSSIKEAFENYLKFNGPAFVSREHLTIEDAIKAIHHAGGLAFLAHPIDIKLEEPAFFSFLDRLKRLGLDGIEAYYSKHTKAQQNYYLHIANLFDFLVTGGSDFHGDNKPNLHLGRGYGGLAVPDNVYFNLRNYWQQTQNLV